MSHYSAVLLFLLVLILALIIFLRFHPKGQQMIHKAVYHFPGMKEIPLALDYSRLCQCLSMGIRSGLPPELYMELANAVVSWPDLRQKLSLTQEKLGKGIGFAEAIEECSAFSDKGASHDFPRHQAGAAEEVWKSFPSAMRRSRLERFPTLFPSWNQQLSSLFPFWWDLFCSLL